MRCTRVLRRDEQAVADSPEAIRFVAKNMRVDLRLIAEMIAPGARVLDIGCGDGTLIDHLFRTKGCDARGIEIDMGEVTRAVAHGLPVMHGDADTDLAYYPNFAFDYVVLSRTLQAVERPLAVCGRCCASARAQWSASQILAIGRSDGNCCARAECR